MKVRLFIIPIHIFFLLLLNGCSVIGYSIGSQIDNSDSNETLPSYYSISRLETGSDIDVVLYNENTISGNFFGSDMLKTVNIEADNRIQKIPLNEIKLIRKSPSYSGRAIGVIAGLALDIIVLRLIISNMTFFTFK